MFDYDKRIEEKYGITYGMRNLVFIKTGNGGSINGYEDKYLHMTEFIHKEIGCNVVISANPVDEKCNLEEEIDFILKEVGPVDEVYYVGMSDGALIGAQQGYKVPIIRDMLLINGPLMINWPRTREGIEKFQGNYVEMLYGTEDPSYKYFEILDAIESKTFKATTFEDADHHFSGKEDALIWNVDVFLKDHMYTLEKFKITENNKFAHVAIGHTVMEAIGLGKKPELPLIYIYGKKGTGKSHLLYGYFNSLDMRSAVANGEEFRAGTLEEDLEFYLNEKILFFDDFQDLEMNEQNNEILYQMFVERINVNSTNGFIIIAADRRPGIIAGLEGRTYSKIMSGLVINLETC